VLGKRHRDREGEETQILKLARTADRALLKKDEELKGITEDFSGMMREKDLAVPETRVVVEGLNWDPPTKRARLTRENPKGVAGYGANY
jgi:hypothetical protein